MNELEQRVKELEIVIAEVQNEMAGLRSLVANGVQQKVIDLQKKMNLIVRASKEKANG